MRSLLQQTQLEKTMLRDTGRFKVLERLTDNAEYSLVWGIWDEDSPALGLHWYNGTSTGFPQSWGKPQWAVIPDELAFHILSGLGRKDLTDQLPRQAHKYPSRSGSIRLPRIIRSLLGLVMLRP